MLAKQLKYFALKKIGKIWIFLNLQINLKQLNY